MLRLVASDHDWALVPERLEETYQPGGEMRHRSLACRELTSGAPEAKEIDPHRADSSSGDAVEHRLPRLQYVP